MEEIKEAQKVLDELKNVRPEKLTGEAKKLFEAIMKIADERDEFEYKYNRAIEDLVKLEKERQADKEKIKELEEEIDDWKFTKNYVEDNYIHKNEIKRKIEELTNSKEYFQMFPDDYLAKIGIEVLQDLLKDEGE